MYETYVNGTLEAQHVTVEGLADYLYMECLLSDSMAEALDVGMIDCTDAMELMHSVMNMVVTGRATEVYVQARAYHSCLRDMVQREMDDAKDGVLTYTLPNGDEVCIEKTEEAEE